MGCLVHLGTGEIFALVDRPQAVAGDGQLLREEWFPILNMTKYDQILSINGDIPAFPMDPMVLWILYDPMDPMDQTRVNPNALDPTCDL